MDHIELMIIIIYNAIFSIIACLAFAIACHTQKKLRPWLSVYICLAIGNFLLIVRFFFSILYFVALLFYALTSILLIIVVFRDYSKIFLKPDTQKLSIQDKLIAIMAVSPFVLGYEIFCLITVSICIVMQIRIYLRTRSITSLFLLMSTISALMTFITGIFFVFDFKGASLLNYLFASFLATMLLSTGFVAILEKKFIDTSIEKNNLKDKYSHDLGNILHAISMIYDLSSMKTPSEIISEDLNDLIKVKIDEASKLVKYIRNL